MISDSTREDFTSSVYDLLADEPNNDKANAIIDFFDIATENCIEAPCEIGDTIYLRGASIGGKRRILNLTVLEISANGYPKKDSVIVTAIENMHLVGVAPKVFKLDSSCFGKIIFNNIEEALQQEQQFTEVKE